MMVKTWCCEMSAGGVGSTKLARDFHMSTSSPTADFRLPADRISAAWESVRDRLLDERNEAGHWTGELCSSALATATAVVALELARQRDPSCDDAAVWGTLCRGGLRYLLDQQLADGGWGDTDRSYANVATTMLGEAALAVAGHHLSDSTAVDRSRQSARKYIDEAGGTAALRRRYGRDKTFAVPILTCAALAGLVPWSAVAPLPFELAVLPQSWYRFLRLPVVSYAIPALVAIGQVRFAKRPPWNPLVRAIRRSAVARTLRVLTEVQPASGGFLEAVPLTSFVVMSLEGMNNHDHQVARVGRRFLVDSVRADGSWPIDTNLATWNTTLAVNHLAAGGHAASRLDCLDWILACQVRSRHRYTGADPGGWGWSDLSGSVPDADDTPGALLALRCFWESGELQAGQRERISEAVDAGTAWLLGLQNRDGGWPTFCRGWGKLPFDRSGDDLTAHALRALAAWRERIEPKRYERAVRRGLRYLERRQRRDGSWWPLWFGNQDHADESNPVYGTAKVLVGLADLDQLDTPMAQRGFHWLEQQQNADGGWGGGPAVAEFCLPDDVMSSVEETALAVEALAAGNRLARPLKRGVQWLLDAVEAGFFAVPSPIGFYFARLWYYERLSPITFTAAALGRVIRVRLPA